MADVFVSYASADRDAAFRIVDYLEAQGIRCWVAPRDVGPGVEYGQAIIDAIGEVRALVLVLSDQSNESQFVRKEVERAVSKTKPVLPVRIREVTPSGALEFYISSAQWVDAWKSPMEQHLLPLVAAIKAMAAPGSAPVQSAVPAAGSSKVWYQRPPVWVAIAIIVVLLAMSLIPAFRHEIVVDLPQRTSALPAKPGRSDIAFFAGTWCQPYNGLTIVYEVIRTGSDTVLTRVDHPQAAPWDVNARIVPIAGGFEMQPLDEPPTDENVARFEIVDDTMMKLVFANGAAEDGSILRMRCDGRKD